MLTLRQLAGSDPRGARRHLFRALAIARALQAVGRLHPEDADIIFEFEADLAALAPTSSAPGTG
jgi:hypothetical protein